jgi:group I intron endonuclease
VIRPEYNGEKGGLYVIQNLVHRNKFYVGTAKDFRLRWNVHLTHLRKGTHHSPKLQADWNELGEHSFSFIILQYIGLKEERLDAEQNFLSHLSCPYNVCRKAVSCEGVQRTESTKKKLRDAMKVPGRLDHIKNMGSQPKSEEHRIRIGLAHLGKTASEAARQKMRESSKKRWEKPEEREKLRAAKLGKLLPRKKPVEEG